MNFTTPSSFLNAVEPIEVTLIGCGGTGHEVLKQLGRIDYTLRQIGFAGFHVTTYDGKKVAKHNCGRQVFAENEIGEYKSEILTQKINEFYGLNWEAETRNFVVNSNRSESWDRLGDITITCTDSVQFRKDFRYYYEDSNGDKFWMDFGNGSDFGQVIWGYNPPNQDDSIPHVFDVLPQMDDMEDDDRPSCSALESVNRQDPFINTMLAQFGCKMIWDWFKNPITDTHGVFINIETLTTSPLKIKL